MLEVSARPMSSHLCTPAGYESACPDKVLLEFGRTIWVLGRIFDSHGLSKASVAQLFDPGGRRETS